MRELPGKAASVTMPETLVSTSNGVGTSAFAVDGRCLNCGAELRGAYCSECGQRARTARVTFPRLLRDFVDHVASVDSKLVRTFRALVRRPGAFVRDFLLGKRAGFARPLPYYLLVVALNVGASAVLRHPAAAEDASGSASFWDQNFVALQIGLAFGLLMVPLAAARRVLHDDADWSVAEHFVFLLYLLAQSILVVLAVEAVLWALGKPLGSDAEGLTWLAAFTGYVVWASREFLGEPRWKIGLKLLAAFAMLVAAVAVIALLLQPLWR
jgi:hypothetical protein